MSYFDVKTNRAWQAQQLFTSMVKESINDRYHYYRKSVVLIIKEAISLYKEEKTFYTIDTTYYSHIVYLYTCFKSGELLLPKTIDKKFITKAYDLFCKPEAMNIFIFY